jgi:hypothetical protein
VKEVLEQLKAVAKGDPKTPDTVKRKFGNIIFAAVRLTPSDILGVLGKVRTECAALPLRILHVCWNPSSCRPVLLQ